MRGRGSFQKFQPQEFPQQVIPMQAFPQQGFPQQGFQVIPRQEFQVVPQGFQVVSQGFQVVPQQGFPQQEFPPSYSRQSDEVYVRNSSRLARFAPDVDETASEQRHSKNVSRNVDRDPEYQNRIQLIMFAMDLATKEREISQQLRNSGKWSTTIPSCENGKVSQLFLAFNSTEAFKTTFWAIHNMFPEWCLQHKGDQVSIVQWQDKPHNGEKETDSGRELA